MLELGSIVQGTVTGITKFGAFVSTSDGSAGLVHISEISNSYVTNVSDFLEVGQCVTAKVISTDNGKLGLSIKRALPQSAPPPVLPDNFEDKLSRYMQDSNRNMAGRYSDKKPRRRGK